MKMSTVASALAGAATLASSPASSAAPSSSLLFSASPARRLASARAAADTAKRRIGALQCVECGNHCWEKSKHRRWRGAAFASPPSSRAAAGTMRPSPSFAIPWSSSPWPSLGSQSQRSFAAGPTRETRLRMAPAHGTEGFRDAIRGGQDYIRRRGPERRTERAPQPERNVAGQPERQLQQQQAEGQQQQQQQERQQQQQERQQQQHRPPQSQQRERGGVPFPKLAPGRRRNYRPPHVATQLRYNAEISGESRGYAPRLSVDLADVDHSPVGEFAPSGGTSKGGDGASAYEEYCDALNPSEREHCIEGFREGEGGRYITVRGGEPEYASAPPGASTASTSSAALTTPASAADEYCDALNPEEREHCLENFRDGISAPYVGVRGGEPEYTATASSVVEQLQQPQPAALPEDVNGDVWSSGTPPLVVDKSTAPEADMESSEHFREALRSLRGSSGSDVEVMYDSLSSSPRVLKSSADKAPAKHNPLQGSSFFDHTGPDSMNFRDGGRMTVFTDDAFKDLDEGPPAETLSNERDDEAEEQSDERLLEETSYKDDADIGDDVDEDYLDDDVENDDGGDDDVLTIDSLLRDTDEEGGVSIETLRRRIREEIAQASDARRQVSTAPAAESESTVSTDPGSKQALLSIDPTSIQIIPLKKGKADEEGRTSIDDASNSNVPKDGSKGASLFGPYGTFSKWDGLADTGSFVKMFRGSASYIANHRGTLAVYHVPGELLAWEGFPGLMDDIALTWLLGMKVVLVAGCRHQIDLRLDDDEGHGDGDGSPLGGKVMMSSIRVTDEETLRVVKEEAGFVRFEIERRLARSLRLHGGLVKGSESLVGNVVSGNFYSAQPFGVVDGIDYCWTGFPRKVEADRIHQIHETNDIVLLTSLGVSPSGEIFNVNSEFLAATVAGSIGASKIIYFNVHGTSFQHKLTEKPVQNLRVSDAKNLLAHYKMRIHPKGFALVDLDCTSPQQRETLRTPGSMETLIKIGYSVAALEKGVQRAHILAPENGALVQELYTRDGCGTLISRDLYEGIRRGNVNDVSGIYDLIDPLVRSGTLVERPKNQLEKDILSYYVYTRDGLIVATGQLKRYEGGFAEIGCLVVSKDYRRGGRGDAMLGYLERLSLQCGAKKVFVLSTQTMEWFVERGFREVPVEVLPPSRQAVYNQKRKSKIYMKEINGDRDLDAAELWWSNK